MRFRLAVILFLTAVTGAAQRPAPAAVHAWKSAVTGVTVHVGNGTVIDSAAVVFSNGYITGVYDLRKNYANEWADADSVYDLPGAHLYPGFILPNSTLGLREIDAVRATLDYAENADAMSPEVRAIVAYNTDSKLIPALRTNGILFAETTPQGGRISGTSGFVQLDAWNWEDAALQQETGLHVNWPSQYGREKIAAEKENNEEKEPAHNLEVEKLKTLFTEAKAYWETPGEDRPFHLKWKALLPVFEGTTALMLHADLEMDLVDAVLFFESLKIPRIVLVEPSRGHKMLSFIRQHALPVILPRVHRLPEHVDSPVFESYSIPALYADSGIVFAFSYSGEMEVMGARNLPFTAGTAVAYGLDSEKAIQALTDYPAQIFGLSQQIGTIEAGKQASFFVSGGDALDVTTNQVLFAWIEGRNLNLGNHQQELYRQYKTRYKLK